MTCVIRDEASNRGAYYNLNRYYDADSGQYLSPDPIGMVGGLRPQGYVHNPMEWVDPLGLTPCKGLPSTRSAGGMGKDYDSVNGQGLYVLHDGKNILYVGRGDAPSRLAVHANTPSKSHLRQDIIFNNNLTKSEAKFLEQKSWIFMGGLNLQIL